MEKKGYKGILGLILALVLAFSGYGVVSNNSDASTTQDKTSETSQSSIDASDAHFRNDYLLEKHYKKHGQAMGYDSAESYEEGAQKVISNPDALTKTEGEDGNLVYYVESSNEIVFVSEDGVIRTYFNPDDGIDYYNRQ